MVGAESRVETIRALARRLRQFERGRPAQRSEPVVASGITPLDQLLPDGGLPRGGVTEWLADGDGVGATSLALMVARNLLDRLHQSVEASASGASNALPGPILAVIDAYRQFYTPAAVRLGLPLDRILLVRPRTAQESLWAWEQCLRCPGVAASVCWCESVNDRVFRRLQLAVEQGGGVAQLIRPLLWRREPSWARVRLQVTSRPQLPGSYQRHVDVTRLAGGSAAHGAGNGTVGGTGDDAGVGDSRAVSILFDDNGTWSRVVAESGH